MVFDHLAFGNLLEINSVIQLGLPRTVLWPRRQYCFARYRLSDYAQCPTVIYFEKQRISRLLICEHTNARLSYLNIIIISACSNIQVYWHKILRLTWELVTEHLKFSYRCQVNTGYRTSKFVGYLLFFMPEQLSRVDFTGAQKLDVWSIIRYQADVARGPNR